MNPTWYEHFFYGVALDLWRKAVTPEQTKAESDFIENMLECGSEARLLDVPCGNGRHSLELAARGYRMTGVDIAVEFVREMEEQAVGLQIETVLGDMRHLPWESEFDGAFCFGNSFGYLDHSGMSAFVAAVSRALKPDGRFLLQTNMAAESILPRLEGRPWWQVDDILMLIDNRYQIRESRMDTKYTFLCGGKRESRKSSHWIYTVGEIQRMLQETNLQTTALYGSLDLQPFEIGSSSLYLLAKKC
ncbi:MAG: class I SAM-dependent methyltransferase [Acidobacteriota bacterium]